jgi:hypothetical protein
MSNSDLNDFVYDRQFLSLYIFMCVYMCVCVCISVRNGISQSSRICENIVNKTDNVTNFSKNVFTFIL